MYNGRIATATGKSSAAEPTPTREPTSRRVRGIDVSHHQGAIDWQAVARDGVQFAYLKATEGTTFTDPAYADQHLGAGSGHQLCG